MDLMTGWLTPTQAARVLGITPLRVRQLMKDGKLDYFSTPLGRLVARESVEQRRHERAGLVAGSRQVEQS
jgi:predicted site-specific integrase-resolvase